MWPTNNALVTLKYFSTERQKKSDPPRSICGECANRKDNKEKCTKKRQDKNSIIPWSVAHTADRNNNWRGVYGRHVWNGNFSTITTNIDPTASSGRGELFFMLSCRLTKNFHWWGFCSHFSQHTCQLFTALRRPWPKPSGRQQKPDGTLAFHPS